MCGARKHARGRCGVSLSPKEAGFDRATAFAAAAQVPGLPQALVVQPAPQKQ